MSRRPLLAVALVAACAPLAACSSTVRKPRLVSPGPAPFQRCIAEQFDPYPQNDMAPEIVGGRPLDYAVPRNEVTRARQYEESKRAQLLPAAPTYVAPPAPLY
jgi:hypothetical protein